MSLWAVIVPYYEERLQLNEGLDIGSCAESEWLAAAREASALRKFLADRVEAGYTDTEALLRDRRGRPPATIPGCGVGCIGPANGT